MEGHVRQENVNIFHIGSHIEIITFTCPEPLKHDHNVLHIDVLIHMRYLSTSYANTAYTEDIIQLVVK